MSFSGNLVVLNQRIFDVIAHNTEALADLVGTPLEAASTQRSGRRLGLSRGSLLQQERRCLGSVRQPAADGAEPSRHDVYRLGVPRAAGTVEAPRHLDGPFFREERRFVSTDFGVRLAVDEDTLGVDVDCLKQPPLEFEPDASGDDVNVLLRNWLLGAGLVGLKSLQASSSTK